MISSKQHIFAHNLFSFIWSKYSYNGRTPSRINFQIMGNRKFVCKMRYIIICTMKTETNQQLALQHHRYHQQRTRNNTTRQHFLGAKALYCSKFGPISAFLSQLTAVLERQECGGSKFFPKDVGLLGVCKDRSSYDTPRNPIGVQLSKMFDQQFSPTTRSFPDFSFPVSRHVHSDQNCQVRMDLGITGELVSPGRSFPAPSFEGC